MSLRQVVLLTVLCGLGGLKEFCAAADESEYTFVMDKLTKEVEAQDIINTDISFEKQDAEVKINGQMKLLVDLDNDWKVNLVVWSAGEADGEYTKVLTMPEKGVCGLLKSYYKIYFYESLKDFSNAPSPSQCPMMKDTYVVKDYILDLSKMSKLHRAGYYRVIGTLSKDGEEKAKYVFEGHAVEVE